MRDSTPMRSKRKLLELLIVIAIVALFGVLRFRDTSSPGAATAATTSYAEGTAPIEGLLLHLPLDGAAEDSSPFHHDTSAVGVTSAVDRRGQAGGACQFTDGSFISIADPQSFNGLEAFTLSAWVNPSQLREHLNIVSKVTPHRDFNLQIDRFGQVASHIMYGPYEFCYTKPKIKPGQWSLVVATYSDKVWKIYVDGDLCGQDTVNNAPPWTSTYLTVGNLDPNGREAFLGSMDDVRIYGRALTSDEISQMMGS